jgi:elongation factor G
LWDAPPAAARGPTRKSGNCAMAYTTTDIRNVALVGHAAAGKTLLAEALLHRAGATKAMGDLARGTTVCDFDPLEKEYKHSLDPAVCHFDLNGNHVNLIDTPGYPDLLGRSMSILAAVETAAVVINAQTGIELATRRMMEAITEQKLCRIIVITKLDAGGDLPALLAQVREEFGKECLPINLPAEGGQKVVDCFFSAEGSPTDFSSVQDAHRAIIEQIVEVDEQLLEKYLEDSDAVTAEQLHDTFEKALREGHLVPICFVSAQSGAGLDALLDLTLKLLPSPREGNPPPFMKGEGDKAEPITIVPGPGGHALAHVFRVSIDPYIGRLGIFRVHQGTVRSGGQLYAGDARKSFKVPHVYKLQGKETIETSSLTAGDIGAIAKVDEIHYDAVLHDSHDEDHHHLKSTTLPTAMQGMALEPLKHGDEQKISDALHKLVAEDPSVRVEQNPVLNETVLYGQGDMHLRVVLEKMKRAYRAEFNTRPPRVPYRETILQRAEGHHRHKKQTGGAGQFGEVYLKVEPLERGAGFEFVDEVVGGAIPHQFIPAVEKGVRQVLGSGAVAGYPLHDVRVIVYDGKTHPVDGKEVAFVSAGRKAFLDAVAKARPIVLEPIMHVYITAPVGAIGDITGDLSAMRGRISNQSMMGAHVAVIEALAPLAELRDYHHKLKAHTAGEGSFTLEFSHYETVPPRVQADMVGAFARRKQEED